MPGLKFDLFCAERCDWSFAEFVAFHHRRSHL